MDLKYTLEALGHEVIYIASRGEEAIEKSLEMLPDLVLMDIILKGDIDGITAAEELRKFDIPFIYLTANSENATQKRALATKPQGYILKPFENKELKETVESALKQTKDNI
ncbi:MAG: hypothetical protein CVV28_06190 [Methanobacteriales archaeon HGW-Methanobacteriales-1]|nr:MAG: hypothetical protein CVV28_06190 [Methanobacteriales archaeon HGW-Methanobacteriales-1]